MFITSSFQQLNETSAQLKTENTKASSLCISHSDYYIAALSGVLPGNHENCTFKFPRQIEDSHRPHGIMHITTASVIPLSITFYHKKKHISNFNLSDKLIESGISATLASKTGWLHIIIGMIRRHWSGTAFCAVANKAP